MPHWLENVLWGVLGSVVASIVFLTLLFLLRPRLKIAPYIARTDTGKDVDYRLKYVNRSWRSCVDVVVDVFVVRDRHVPTVDGSDTGVVRSMKRAKTSNTSRYVPGYRPRDKDAPHCRRLRVDEEIIAAMVNSDQTHYLLVRIFARDGVSGFSRVIEKEFKVASAVREGTFAHGKSMSVVDWQPQGGQQPQLNPPDPS